MFLRNRKNKKIEEYPLGHFPNRENPLHSFFVDHELFLAALQREVRFSFSRSAGCGGQNVNKVSTRVTASLDLSRLEGLTDEEAALIRARLARRINAEGILSVTAQDTRSQARNRGLAVFRLEELLGAALLPRAKRRPTKPTTASRRARREAKKHSARKKAERKRPAED